MYKTGDIRHNQRTVKWAKASDVGVSTTAVIVVLRIYLFCDLTTAFSAFGCDWKPIVLILIAKQNPRSGVKSLVKPRVAGILK